MSARSLRSRLIAIGSALLLILGLAVFTSTSAQGHTPSKHKPKQTVVLVHGAWADSSSWDGVISRLQHDGYTVDVFPAPLRGLASDSAYLRTYLAAISGPIVLVGHSYGGAVITDAATGNKNVTALVYIDGFAPAAGENVLALAGPNSALANPDPTKVFSFVPNAAPTATTDLYVLQSFFPSAFANDLPAKQSAVLAATQRPIAFGALSEASSTPAWLSIPSWYEVGTIDKVIPPSAQLTMAQRAHSHIIKVKSSHLAMISQPGAVDRTIETAARGTD
jgi:pimeloyl-ACP methyl ester carboxylesterase